MYFSVALSSHKRAPVVTETNETTLDRKCFRTVESECNTYQDVETCQTHCKTDLCNNGDGTEPPKEAESKTGDAVCNMAALALIVVNVVVTSAMCDGHA